MQLALEEEQAKFFENADNELLRIVHDPYVTENPEMTK